MRFFLILLFAFIPLSVTAQPAGHEDPRLQSAIQAWLADDDQTALPALAKLAAEGNTAAQILLGRIANRPMGPWLAGMNRKDRNKLMRAPGGLSGKSWLKVAAEGGDELAAALLEMNAPPAGETNIIALTEAGETSAALDLAGVTYGRTGSFQGRGIIVTDAETHGGVYFPADEILKSQVLLQKGDYRLRPAIEELAPGFKPAALYTVLMHDALLDQPKLLTPGQLQNARDRSLLMNESSPLAKMLIGTDAEITHATPLSRRPAQVLRSLCAHDCNAEAEACVTIGLKAAGGEDALSHLYSPTETLIPFETYAASARAVADLRRHIRNSPTYHPARYRPQLSCFDAAFPEAD